jgi:transposase
VPAVQEGVAQRSEEHAANAVTLTLPQGVWAYRGQYRIEDDWTRLKGRSLGLTPVYLQDEARIQGLVYLLSVALRLLTQNPTTTPRTLGSPTRPV